MTFKFIRRKLDEYVKSGFIEYDIVKEFIDWLEEDDRSTEAETKKKKAKEYQERLNGSRESVDQKKG